MYDAIPPEPPTPGEIASDVPVLAALSEAFRAENRSAFGKVDTAAEFYTRWMNRRDCLTERHANTWGHAGLTEISTRLACSHTIAERYAELGTAMRDRLPETRAAFAAGDIDYAKAWRIAIATGGFSEPVVAEVEKHAVAIAGRFAPARFSNEVDALLIRTAPDEYAELRKDAEKWARRVRRRNVGTLSRIEADLSPEEAAAVWQRIAEVGATVCAHDPRAKQHRLVDAYLAIMHGEDHLTCTCERPDCAADPTPASRRKPLVQITVEAGTLLGLRSEPAFLPGHGPIDAELARRIAQDATWQGALTELIDIAVTAGILTAEQAAALSQPAAPAPVESAEDRRAKRDPAIDTTAVEHPAAEPRSDDDESGLEADAMPDAALESNTADDTMPAAPEPDTVSDAAPEPGGADDTVSDAAPEALSDGAEAVSDTAPDATAESDTAPSSPTDDATIGTELAPEPGPPPPAADPNSPVESELHTRLCHPLLATFVGRGTRRPSGYVPSCAPRPVLVPLRQADLYVEYTKLIEAHPELADGIHPDGHGGLDTPPPGALTYRPSAETAALVRARDRHCRFPGCDMPAARCQLDHITAFDHEHPAAGGWTIVSNIQCACAFHHELKTAGLWRARALPGAAILWTGPRGDRHLTLPAGGLTPVPAAADLTPDVGGGRAKIDRPEPDKPPPF